MPIKDRGFASMDEKVRRAIQSKGGKACHKLGKAHEWTTEEARAAGRLGGLKSAKVKAEKKRQLELLAASGDDLN